MLFLIGSDHNARLIKPQIDFHHAHDLPVYSINSSYSGKPDEVKDLDLEGIIFGDMPWVLNHGAKSQVLRARVSRDHLYTDTILDRLFAFGIDAYGLINHLPDMQRRPEITYIGLTGALSLTKHQKIQRRLEWFQIHQAQPVHLPLSTLPAPPRLMLPL